LVGVRQEVAQTTVVVLVERTAQFRRGIRQQQNA